MADDPIQTALFHEDIYDALWDVVKYLGGAKRVGHDMEPKKSPEQAGRWLANCLDKSRAEKLDPEQVLYLLRRGREEGCHIAMAYINRECCYAEPVPVAPEDEKARLQREYVEAVKTIKTLGDQLAKMQGIA